MIGVSVRPSSSSAARIAPTRPSIMSLGAMTSAPARAWLIAVRARSSTDESLSTWPSARSRPQWPWLVYSHRHRSAMTSRSGWAALIARVASCTAPSSSHAPEPSSSFAAGMPDNSPGGWPAPRAAPASATTSASDRRSTPGMAAIGARPSRPSSTNRGRTKSDGSSRVSRTRSRRTGVRRSRRRRVWGNGTAAMVPAPRGRSAALRSRSDHVVGGGPLAGARKDPLGLGVGRGGVVLGLVLARGARRVVRRLGLARRGLHGVALPAPRAAATAVEARPLLRGHREDVVVLPDAVDAQVAVGAALQAEAGLLGDADRADVARDDRRLHAVQARVLEGEGEAEAYRSRRMPARAAGVVDPVAERRVLPRAAHDVGQRDAPDEPLAAARVEDREGEGAARGPGLRVEVELERLAAARVEARVARGLPRSRVVAVGQAQREQLFEVGAVRRADGGVAVLQADPLARADHRRCASSGSRNSPAVSSGGTRSCSPVGCSP